MAVEEALRGDGETLGVDGVCRYPGVAGREPSVAAMALTSVHCLSIDLEWF